MDNRSNSADLTAVESVMNKWAMLLVLLSKALLIHVKRRFVQDLPVSARDGVSSSPPSYSSLRFTFYLLQTISHPSHFLSNRLTVENGFDTGGGGGWWG